MYGLGQPYLSHSSIYTNLLLGLAKTIHTYVYTMYVQYFWQGNYHTYGHIRCTYMVLANPRDKETE
jgi:hypothetical protein